MRISKARAYEQKFSRTKQIASGDDLAMATLLNSCPFYKAAVKAKLKELADSQPAAKFVLAFNSHRGLSSGSLVNCVIVQLGTNRIVRANRAEGSSLGQAAA